VNPAKKFDIITDELRHVAEPSLCHEVTDAAGKPEFHYCSLPRWHSGPHLCDFCGSAWSSSGKPTMHERQKGAQTT